MIWLVSTVLVIALIVIGVSPKLYERRPLLASCLDALALLALICCTIFLVRL